MRGISIYKMKQQLTENNVGWSEDDSIDEIKKKFYNLPITEGQIHYLASRNIKYDETLNWTRGDAKKFIKEAEIYFKLRNLLPASPMQKMLLYKHGVFFENMTSGQAAELISCLPAEPEQIRYIEAYKLKHNNSVPLTYAYCQYIIGKHQTMLNYSRLHR